MCVPPSVVPRPAEGAHVDAAFCGFVAERLASRPGLGLVEGGEERFVAHLFAERVRIPEESIGGVQYGQGRVGVGFFDLAEESPEQGVFDRFGVEEVELQLQQCRVDGAWVVGDEGLQVGDLARHRLAGEDGPQHGHEVRLTGAEGAGDVHALVVAGGQAGFDVAQRLVHGGGDVVGDDVAFQGLAQVGRLGRAFDLEHERLGLVFGNVEDVAQQRGGG